MGDTGSMFLGGMVVSFAFCIDRPVYLLLAGIVYLVEAFSVILQVFWFKKTGKRLFKMSPIHHHFEKSGWSEVKIVIIFSLITLISCAICVTALKFF
jgi:phospho-N-acetylmuramoyl-pentapeptide-transferase